MCLFIVKPKRNAQKTFRKRDLKMCEKSQKMHQSKFNL